MSSTIKERVYILKRVNYGGSSKVENTYNITETVDPETIELNDDQITHVGNSRDGDLVSDIIDDLLYEMLEILAFTVNGFSQYELEEGATLDTVNFAWGYNKAVTSQSISGGITLVAGDRTKTLESAGITEDTSWILTGNDGVNAINKTASAVFRNSIRWIASSETSLDSSILATWESRLSADANHVFTVNAASDEYIYFAAPQSMGTPLFFIGGFEEVFIQTALTYVNAQGHSEDYYIYKSENVGLGETTVTVINE